MQAGVEVGDAEVVAAAAAAAVVVVVVLVGEVEVEDA